MDEKKTIIAVAVGSALIVWLSGCTYIAGPKEVIKMSDGTEITRYITGLDFAVAMSGTDEVENHRGIKPTK